MNNEGSQKSKWRVGKAILYLLLFCTSLTLSSCGHTNNEKKASTQKFITPKKPEYKVIEVKRGKITREIKGPAIFVSSKQEEHYFKLNNKYVKAINATQGDTVKKGDILAELDPDDLSLSVKEQEINLKLAQLNYEQLKASQTEGFEVEKARLQVELENLKLQGLLDEMGKTKIISGIDGKITYSSTVKIGERASSDIRMFVIADPKALAVEYSGGFAQELSPGMKADVWYKSVPYHGEVVTNTFFSKKVSPSGNEKIYARVKLDSIPNGVEMGTSVDISVKLVSKENVIVLPKDVIREFNGQKYVLVLENGIRAERNIITGITTDTEAEVIQGLNEGDKVIIN